MCLYRYREKVLLCQCPIVFMVSKDQPCCKCHRVSPMQKKCLVGFGACAILAAFLRQFRNTCWLSGTHVWIGASLFWVMVSQAVTFNGVRVPSDKEHNNREKLHELLQSHAWSGQSDECSDYESRQAVGGFDDIYRTHLYVYGERIRVALNQMRPSSCANEGFAKARYSKSFAGRPPSDSSRFLAR